MPSGRSSRAAVLHGLAARVSNQHMFSLAANRSRPDEAAAARTFPGLASLRLCSLSMERSVRFRSLTRAEEPLLDTSDTGVSSGQPAQTQLALPSWRPGGDLMPLE